MRLQLRGVDQGHQAKAALVVKNDPRRGIGFKYHMVVLSRSRVCGRGIVMKPPQSPSPARRLNSTYGCDRLLGSCAGSSGPRIHGQFGAGMESGTGRPAQVDIAFRVSRSVSGGNGPRAPPASSAVFFLRCGLLGSSGDDETIAVRPCKSLNRDLVTALVRILDECVAEQATHGLSITPCRKVAACPALPASRQGNPRQGLCISYPRKRRHRVPSRSKSDSRSARKSADETDPPTDKLVALPS